jgi:hypothetical protein
MTTDPVDDPEPEDEVDTILAHLVAERTDAHTPTLAIHQIALLHKAAILMTSGTADDVKDLTTLLSLAPKVIRPGARPTPTLVQACKPDAPWDLSRLSNQQLLDLEIIAATAQGRACPLRSPRLEAILDLTTHLDGAGEPDVERVRESLGIILAPKLTLDAVQPSHAAELSSERARRVALEEDVRRLSRVVAEASLPLPANVVKLRTAASAAAAAASAVSAPAAPVGHIGDHPGFGGG